MNTPISNSGQGNSVERVTPVSTGSSSSSTVSHETSFSSKTATGITNIDDLKLAELRGDGITLSDEQAVKTVERAIKAMQGRATNLQFSVHKETNLIAVKIVDSESGEVLKEIPPEKSLDFVAKLWEMAGIFVDKKG
ncbi:flagellar protein FlaG [Paenibacillus sp. HB172176]|uniref:flagellar protein FlaG n=1 Tax=Paenibacillus sp. HB172176 TaxID=2493690 RepID=UPI00143C0EDE|nr:flagellar protein FlaG [Paenibacillus sp. HB172176]